LPGLSQGLPNLQNVKANGGGAFNNVNQPVGYPQAKDIHTFIKQNSFYASNNGRGGDRSGIHGT
jgi:hypothetical protein